MPSTQTTNALSATWNAKAEQHAISFILGSAYMEDDIRAKTDATGFCRHHFKMMYNYGNRLGNALILSTHLKKAEPGARR